MNLPGQGKPLPWECPFNGQWLIEDMFFLYSPKPQQLVNSKPSRQTAEWKPVAGGLRIGIDVDRIAEAFGLSTDQILEANKTKLLELIRAVKIHDGRHGGRTVRFEFAIRDRLGLVLVGYHEGLHFFEFLR